MTFNITSLPGTPLAINATFVDNLPLLLIGMIIVYGLVAKIFFKKFRIPDVLLLLSLGAVLSFFNFKVDLVYYEDMLNILLTFALIYIVFSGGLPIRIKAVFSTAKGALFSSLLNLFSITIVIAGISLIFFDLKFAIALGLLLCVMDGSIINSILDVVNFSKRAEAFIQIESALVDVFVIVAIWLVHLESVIVSTYFQLIVNFLLLSTAIGVATGLLWGFFLKKAGKMQHVSLTTIALLLLVFVFSETFQANGVIAVFAFAITLGNVQTLRSLMYKEDSKSFGGMTKEQRTFMDDFAFLLRTLLFVFIGTLIDFNKPWYLALGLLFAVLALVIRSFVFKLIKHRDTPQEDIYMMEVMAAKGMTPVVMMALIKGSTEFNNTIIGAIFSSVLIGSILIFLIEKKKFTTITDIFKKKQKMMPFPAEIEPFERI